MTIIYFDDPRKVPDRPPKQMFTVVLDVDETLVHKDGADVVHIRPCAKELIQVLGSFGDIEILIWSAGKQSHVRSCLEILDVSNMYAISRSSARKWDKKDMALIARKNRTLDTIMIIDDRNDTITSTIHFHVNDWRGDDNLDDELCIVKDNILSHIMISQTQERHDCDLGPFGFRDSKAKRGIYDGYPDPDPNDNEE